MNTIKKIGRNNIISIIGGVLLALPVLFLENTTLCGTFNILGLSLLLYIGKNVEVKSEIVVNGICMLLGYSIRFSTFFGTDFILSLFIFLCFIPYTLVLCGSMRLTKVLKDKNLKYLSILIFPIVYTITSYILAIINLGYLPNVFGYVMLVYPISNCLSYLGEYGITFILSLFISLVIAAISEKDKKRSLKYIAISSVVILGLVSFGLLIPKENKEPDYSIKVALATSQEMDFLGKSDIEYDINMQLEMFGRELDEAKNQEADLMVLNEEYFSVNYLDEGYLYSEISRLVKEKQIPVLAGIELVKEDDLWINEAIYFNSLGEIEYSYIKNNLVPFVENRYYVDGEDIPANIITVIGNHYINLSFVICCDINDEMYIRKISSKTELLIVPSWDWNTVNIEQLRTSIRAAVLNVTMLKHSFEGFSFVAIPDGKKEQIVDFRKQYEKVVTIEVPIWEK